MNESELYKEPGALTKDKDRRKAHNKTRMRLIPVVMIVALVTAFGVYTGQYYHAGAVARSMLESSAAVAVKTTDYGWLFDGPSETDALIFYPGAKVEETAYAPLLHNIAQKGMDVCLVKMPFRLAIFGINKAEKVIAAHNYSRWYIGGHSLGGAMAASYATAHDAQLAGVVLLAAYSQKPLDDHLLAITVYGSNDGVLNLERLAADEKNLPKNHRECVIEGGNHAQFGDYGAQTGDGKADISTADQQRRTADFILGSIRDSL